MAIINKSLGSNTCHIRDYGLSLLFHFYVVTRFTPTIVRILG